MGFPDGQAAYEQKKRELHAKLDQTKKVSPTTSGWNRLDFYDRSSEITSGQWSIINRLIKIHIWDISCFFKGALQRQIN